MSAITIAHADAATVAIVGAGELGGALAHVLARRDVAPDDPPDRRERPRRRRQGARHHAGRAGRGLRDAAVRDRPISTASPGAAIVVDRRSRSAAASGRATTALLLLKRLSQTVARRRSSSAPARRSASSSSAAFASCTCPRARLFGSAPEALAGGVRALVALERRRLAARRRAVGARRPAAITSSMPWEDATVGGFALTRLLDEPARRRLAARVAGAVAAGPVRARVGGGAGRSTAMCGGSRAAADVLRRAGRLGGRRARGSGAAGAARARRRRRRGDARR